MPGLPERGRRACAVERLVTGRWKENCYLVSNEANATWVVDPGANFPAIRDRIEQLGLSIQGILNTHAHYDHVGAVSELQDLFGVPFYLHRAEWRLLRQANLYLKLAGVGNSIKIPRVDNDLASIDTVTMGSTELSVIPCPGHTPGGVAFLVDGHLFTGDSLMKHSIGRTDFPGSDRTVLVRSVRRLLNLPPDTLVHPGHGSEFLLKTFLEAHPEFVDPIA